MNLKEKFIQAKEELDSNGKLEIDTQAGSWDYSTLNNGYIINDGVDPSLLEEFVKRSPVEIPDILKNAWLDTNGFTGAWSYEYEYREGQFTKTSLNFGLMPMEEAFGGLNEIKHMCDRMENDELLQWVLLNIDTYEDNAEETYVDPSGMDYDRFEGIIRNSIFLEYFSVDLLAYTLLKLDAVSGEPSLYLTYGVGLYPLTLNLEEYLEAIIEFKGLSWPWPMMFVNKENLQPEFVKEIEKKTEQAKKISKDLKLDVDFEKYGL